MEEPVPTPQIHTTSPRVYKTLNIFFFLCACVLGGYYLFSAPPVVNNNREAVIHISSSDTITSLAQELEVRNIIRYDFVLRGMLLFLGPDFRLEIGDYRFKKEQPVWKIAWQIYTQRHDVVPIRVTLREGITNADITRILSDNISAFRKDLFVTDARYKQGYLFPDTYFFYPLSTTDEILDELSGNFKKRTKSLTTDIEKSGKILEDIIVMASIIEKEAKGQDDASMISGILWKRIKIGMPLQADAAPITYREKGLPKEPIGNPGLVSIRASVYPTGSAYLYYLHDKKGQIYYAKTYDEHRKNISLYLR
jgi:UPF0755 protein